MAELERIYKVPLRKEFSKAPYYKRTKRAISALKAFLLRHMKGETVKIGKHLNERMWEHGIKNPPHHIVVAAVKDDKGIVRAELPGIPFEVKKEKKKEKKEAKKEEPKKDAQKPKASGSNEVAATKEEKPSEETKEKPKKEAPKPEAKKETKLTAEECEKIKEIRKKTAKEETKPEEKTKP